jgi:L-lactate dehydrogenase
MTRKVGVIGSGNVGSTLANNMLVAGTADTLVLIDTNELKLNSDATDFEDAAANLPTHTTVVRNDYEALADADVVVIAVGSIGVQNDDAKHDRFVELKVTSKAAKEVGTKLKEVGFHGVLVSISNPCDVIAALFQKYTGLPKTRVIGTGTLLDTSRMKKVVGQKFDVDPRSVSGYNLGEHGNSQFSAWSQVRVMGHPVTELAKDRDDVDLDQLAEDVRAGGYVVFHGKKHTNFGIAAAALRLVTAVLNDAHAELPVSNFAKNTAPMSATLPSLVAKGLVRQLQLDLTDEEKDKLAASG